MVSSYELASNYSYSPKNMVDQAPNPMVYTTLLNSSLYKMEKQPNTVQAVPMQYQGLSYQGRHSFAQISPKNNFMERSNQLSSYETQQARPYNTEQYPHLVMGYPQARYVQENYNSAEIARSYTNSSPANSSNFFPVDRRNVLQNSAPSAYYAQSYPRAAQSMPNPVRVDVSTVTPSTSRPMEFGGQNYSSRNAMSFPTPVPMQTPNVMPNSPHASDFQGQTFSRSANVPHAMNMPASLPSTISDSTNYSKNSQPNSSGACMALILRKPKESIHRFQSICWNDEFYVTNPTAIQRIALKFEHVLDPSLLLQSLDDVVKKFPTITSKICHYQGKLCFHLASEQVTLRVILVKPHILSDMNQWYNACNEYRPVSNESTERPPLFQAFILLSNDPSHGCVFVVCFDHVLGDAITYGIFLNHWSQEYSLLKEKFGTNLASSLSNLPPCMYERPSMPPPITPPHQIRMLRYELNTQFLSTVKAQYCSPSDRLSTNDILMAQCACALAPHRKGPQAMPYAHIIVLTDRRKRGLSEDFFGNAVVDINVYISMQLLLEGNVLAVARDIRKAVNNGLYILEHNLPKFNEEKLAAEKSPYPKLFVWNSWMRAGRSILDAKFGEEKGVLRFEWLNLLANATPNSPEVILAFPVAQPSGTMAIQISSENWDEFKSIAKYWGEGKQVGLDHLRR
ncbi:hypothetical protein GUITHDRAFT_121297 [Guillardia theta CCMP2712]|uniref:Uncharacterized protein n=1 Tax=Guillardia theta (strain CCMP2712) TaxID=905079 RepID=L1I9L1_GUITC|nr:hypothetical protein GUITHDRAFT_121297 [Guillardia theta CCMP2712]EKX32545.1 hypothetical protein GUITHDRAFT_121297 [Guillardia theta CCMP2712]|eukprot:XP_005819525.1 hypothetical protein GUITHDRAFT_121297 [Guillardia theta CCMP2712]